MYFRNVSLIFLVAFAGLAYALNKQRDCKCRLNDVSSRIVGGRKASNNKYPWYVSLAMTGLHKNSPYLSNVDDEFKGRDSSCGATIINERWLITAAHCVDDEYSVKGLAIGFGDNDLKVMWDNGKLPAKRVITYPMFNSFGNVNDDFALIELEEPLTFSDKVAPACLGLNYRSDPDNTLMSIGHGIKDYNDYYIEGARYDEGSISRYLKETEAQDTSTLEISAKECKLRPNRLCTKAFEEGSSTCQGDSGSPVMVTKNGRTFVLGVLSTTKMAKVNAYKWSFCAGEGQYQRVSPYADFIKHHVGEFCSDADF